MLPAGVGIKRDQPEMAAAQACKDKKMKGFTLIELMIVVLIIGIIASVAMPAYSAYITNAKLAEALTTLRSTGNAMEINLSATNAYVCAKTSWHSKYFSYECTASTNSYTITANGLGDIANYSYSLNSEGEHKTLAHPAGSSDKCWRISKAC
jgi:type IV pilus assembly protein PilE